MWSSSWVAYGKERAAERGKTIRFTLTTNAYALTDEIIDFLNREMENVVLSIDGRKEVHDALRPTASGEGSYDVSLANAKKLAQAGANKSITCAAPLPATTWTLPTT